MCIFLLNFPTHKIEIFIAIFRSFSHCCPPLFSLCMSPPSLFLSFVLLLSLSLSLYLSIYLHLDCVCARTISIPLFLANSHSLSLFLSLLPVSILCVHVSCRAGRREGGDGGVRSTGPDPPGHTTPCCLRPCRPAPSTATPALSPSLARRLHRLPLVPLPHDPPALTSCPDHLLSSSRRSGASSLASSPSPLALLLRPLHS